MVSNADSSATPVNGDDVLNRFWNNPLPRTDGLTTRSTKTASTLSFRTTLSRSMNQELAGQYLRSKATASAVGYRTSLYRSRNREPARQRFRSMASAVGSLATLYPSRNRELAIQRLRSTTTRRCLTLLPVPVSALSTYRSAVHASALSVDEQPNGACEFADDKLARSAGWTIHDEPARSNCGRASEPLRYSDWRIDDEPASCGGGLNDEPTRRAGGRALTRD